AREGRDAHEGRDALEARETGEARGGPELERARLELRRLGYLDHGLERFLLQDALRPRQPLRTMALLAAKVGLLTGGVLAAALAVALVAANGSIAVSPLDLPVLFVHLFPPAAAAAAAAFLALASAVLAVLRFYPVRRIEAVALATALVAGLAGLALALWEARATLAGSGTLPRLALGLGAAAAAYALVRLVYQGLLALAIRFTERAPAAGLLAWRWRRWVSGAVLAGVLLLAVPVVLAARAALPPPPPLLPTAPGERTLVLGLDGVLPEEIEYLLRHGDLPAMAELERGGARLLRYLRPDEPPAAFWTSLATGLAPPEHGVAALDSFLPLGVTTPLARSGLLRAYWSRVAVPLRLAAYRPVLANRRSAFTLWELASRGGAPVLAVNWWATFPARPLPGLVLAHDAYQLLREGAAGAVSAPEAVPELLHLANAAAAAPIAGRTGAAAADDEGGARRLLAAALPPAEAAAVAERSVRPDAFYRQVFAGRLSRMESPPRAAALYLPGLDIAAAGWHGGGVAFADLVRTELAAADRLLARALSQPGLGAVAVVLDPGRRHSPVAGGGRVLLWQRLGCGGPGDETAPEAITSGLLRTLGLPQSAELPPPPSQCSWPPPPATVAGFGRRQPGRLPGAPAEAGDEYLRNLRSLGYL
ncbi:MAG: alkaline phosphatase family protein, partial [Acidobacteria bacterium]|nr:alkaline phosphatase family protein [Acidobacteriota bacterium]